MTIYRLHLVELNIFKAAIDNIILSQREGKIKNSSDIHSFFPTRDLHIKDNGANIVKINT